jgi:aldehyde:ferredoxin oxidoreductase
MRSGRRILTLEKGFNVREGADRKDDVLPWRLMNEPLESLMRGEDVSKAIETEQGFVPINSPDMLNPMLDEYYDLHGWDKTTSWPYRETLLELGLKEVVEELEPRGKVPRRSGK